MQGKSRTRKRPGRRANKGAETSQALVNKINSVPIPKCWGTRNLGAPPMMRIKMAFTQEYVIAGATPFIVYDWKANSPVIPDPILGATFPATGVPSWSQIYNQYLVEKCAVEYDVTANEPAFPVSFGWTWKDYQPSTAGSTFKLASNLLSIEPTDGFHSIGETTGMSVWDSRKDAKPPLVPIQSSAIVGNPFEYFGELGYSSTFNTVPAQSLWGSFVLLSVNNATNLTNGVKLSLRLIYDVLMFSPSANLV
jgi:hypothetical protein